MVQNDNPARTPYTTQERPSEPVFTEDFDGSFWSILGVTMCGPTLGEVFSVYWNTHVSYFFVCITPPIRTQPETAQHDARENAQFFIRHRVSKFWAA